MPGLGGEFESEASSLSSRIHLVVEGCIWYGEVRRQRSDFRYLANGFKGEGCKILAAFLKVSLKTELCDFQVCLKVLHSVAKRVWYTTFFTPWNDACKFETQQRRRQKL